jgi:hypothetical protein
MMAAKDDGIRCSMNEANQHAFFIVVGTPRGPHGQKDRDELFMTNHVR